MAPPETALDNVRHLLKAAGWMRHSRTHNGEHTESWSRPAGSCGWFDGVRTLTLKQAYKEYCKEEQS